MLLRLGNFRVSNLLMRGYFGYRGQGKTMSLVSDIWSFWMEYPDLVLLSNTPMGFGNHPVTGKPMDFYLWNSVEELQDFFRFAVVSPDLVMRRFTVVVIDEANLVMPSRLFAKLDPFVLSFLAESRKLNCEIFFTTQHPLRPDKVLRELTEEWVECTRVPILGWIRQERMVLTSEGKPVESLGSSWLLRKSKYGAFYNTRHIVGMDEALLPRFQGHPKMLGYLESVFDPNRPKSGFFGVFRHFWHRLKTDFGVVTSDIKSFLARSLATAAKNDSEPFIKSVKPIRQDRLDSEKDVAV